MKSIDINVIYLLITKQKIALYAILIFDNIVMRRSALGTGLQNLLRRFESTLTSTKRKI